MEKEITDFLTAGEKERVDAIMEQARKRKGEFEKDLEGRVQAIYGYVKVTAEFAGKRPCEIAGRIWQKACGLRADPVCGPCELCDEELPF